MRATGIAGYASHGSVKMAPGPFQKLDSETTVIYEIQGMSVSRCSLEFTDRKGGDLKVTGEGTARGASAYTLGYQIVEEPISVLGKVRLRLGRRP
jgi:hypothetical protein